MKNAITHDIKNLFAHRRLVITLFVLLFAVIGAITYIAVTLEASVLRVITHYTAFGVTHFYRDSWTYFFSFIGFIVIAFVFSIGMALKLLRQDREPLALLVGWLGVAMVALAVVIYVHLAELL